MSNLQRKPRILFLPVPLAGHFVHTRQLLEYLSQTPEKYELHVSVVREFHDQVPEGVQIHELEGDMDSTIIKGVFVRAAVEASTPLQSVAYYVKDTQESGLLTMGLDEAMRAVRTLQPDLVVAESVFCFGNHFHAFCRANAVRLINLTPMARPEIDLTLGTILRMLLTPRVLWNIVTFFRFVAKYFEEHSGGVVALKDSDKPITIFPGPRHFCEVVPKQNEIFCGSFGTFPDAAKVKGSLPRDLEEWLRGGPVIYVALGTVVKPPPALLGRIVEGLSNGPWRVLWALPELYAKDVPSSAQDIISSSPSVWRTQSWVPQKEVLMSGYVKCFLSHCGCSSTAESITASVPMICLPFFGDQWEWAETVTKHFKAGVQVNKITSSAKDIHDAASRIMGSSEFYDSMSVVSSLARQEMERNLATLQMPQSETYGPGLPVAAAVIDAVITDKDATAVLTNAPRSKL